MQPNLLALALLLSPAVARAAPRELTRKECTTLMQDLPPADPSQNGADPTAYRARVRPDAWLHHSRDTLPEIADPRSRWQAPDLEGWHVLGRQAEQFRVAAVAFEREDGTLDEPPVSFQRRQRALYDLVVHQDLQADTLERRLQTDLGDRTDPRVRAVRQADIARLHAYGDALLDVMYWVVELDDPGQGEALVAALSAAESVMPALLERHAQQWLANADGDGLADLARVRVINCLHTRLDAELRAMGRYEGSPVLDRTLSIPSRASADLDVGRHDLGAGSAEVYLAVARGAVQPVATAQDGELVVQLLVAR